MLTREGIAYIVSRVLDNAKDTIGNRSNVSDTEEIAYESGRIEAYYEVLDTIKNELIIRDEDMRAFGLDFNLEEMF